MRCETKKRGRNDAGRKKTMVRQDARQKNGETRYKTRKNGETRQDKKKLERLDAR